MHAPLHDAEQGLMSVSGGFPCSVAAPRPCERDLSRLAGAVIGSRIGRALVQAHHDIGVQPALNCDGLLWAEQVGRSVDVRLKTDPFCCDPGQLGKGEHLEAAAVGQDGAAPVHEPVQSMKPVDDLAARPQVEMIGIAEDDLGAASGQLFGRDGLHRSQRAHRHEYRCFHRPVGRLHHAGPRKALGRLFDDVKPEHPDQCPT